MTPLDDLIAAVEAGYFPADASASDLGLTGEYDGVPVIECLYDAFGGSLDAALRLHEALLPGCGWDIWRTLDHLPNGMSRKMYGCNLPMTDTAYTDNPARSWLLAILRALKAKEAGNE